MGFVVAVAGFDERKDPTFKPLRCSQASCHKVIESSMFVSKAEDVETVVCEDCYRSTYYGNPSFTKAYKHCVLKNTNVTLAKYTELAKSALGTESTAKAAALSAKLEAEEGPPKWTWDRQQRERNAVVADNEPGGPLYRVATDPAADGEMPLFLRKSAAKRPFANVHMALRVGPLVIETGVAQYVPPCLSFQLWLLFDQMAERRLIRTRAL